jgi:hypothetical protein
VQQHSQTTSTIDVETFNNHDRAPRRFAQGRVCRDDFCGTQLSIYNDGYFCTLHAPLVAPRVRGRKIRSKGSGTAPRNPTPSSPPPPTITVV